MVDGETLSKGALLFVDGRITSLRFLKKETGFEAMLQDGEPRTATAQMQKDGNPTWQCGCRNKSVKEPCQHVVAVLAALSYIFHEYNFLNLSPIQPNVNLLAKCIDSSAARVQKKLTQLKLETTDNDAYVIRGNAALPHELCYAIDAHTYTPSIRETHIELPPYDEWRGVLGAHRYACEKQIKFVAHVDTKEALIIHKEIGKIQSVMGFDYASKQKLVIADSELVEDAANPVEEFFGLEGVLLKNGTLATIVSGKVEDLLSYFEPDFSSRRSYQASPIGISGKDFNLRVMALGAKERKLMSEARFALNGVPVELKEPEEPEGSLTLSLNLKPSKRRGSDRYAFSLIEQVGDYKGDGSMLFLRLSDLVYDAARGNRLLGAKARVEALFRIASQLPLLANQKSRNAHIKAALGEGHHFEKPDIRRAATRFLKNVARDYCNERAPSVPMLLPSGSGESPWQSVRLPMAAALQLVCELYLSGNIKQLLSSYNAPGTIESDPDHLRRLAMVCDAHGIVLLFDGRPLESVDIQIEVEATSNETLDWFELKADIRCGTATIPRNQWEQLLRGQLILESDGRMIIPRHDRKEAMRQLMTLIPETTQGTKAGKAHAPHTASRLEMLTWIALRREGAQVKLPAAAENIFRSLLQFESIPKRTAPRSIQAKLRDYQKRGFEWLAFLYEHRFGACLADDMGLGKTLQAMTFLSFVKNRAKTRNRFLIVVPPSLLFNWQNEFELFCPTMRVTEYAGSQRCFKSCKKGDVILTTYDTLRRDIEILEKEHFEVVIFDEAQTLKNHASRRTKAAHRLKRRFSLCLTGTPMENHAGEYHTIMELALPGLMGGYDAFQKDIREGRMSILRRAQPFLLRRTKDAILKELPPKQESDLYLEMSKEQKEIYTRAVGEVREEVLSAFQKKTKSQAGIVALAALTRLRQTCVSPELLGKPMKKPAPKIEYLTRQLTELIDEGHSALVFSQFLGSLDCIERSLQAKGLTPLRLDGSTPTPKRKKVVEAFQTKETPQIFLISLKAGGVGLNLTNASYVIHVDPWWNPSVENQASDRAHRIGQKQTVFIQRLIMRHTIEEKIMKLKRRKQALFESIVNESSSGKRGQPLISRDDFQFLLSEE